MKEFEARHIYCILVNAQRSGIEAGESKLKELRKAGPRWAVKDEDKNKIVGTMLDVCGCTALHLTGHSKIVRAIKLLGKPNRHDDLSYGAFSISRNTYRGGYGLMVYLSNRQELSVREEAVKAFCDWCEKHGLECTWSSRID
ncbi:hypothetical protein ES695_11390 [Candidatus Atribacteria bacterium 1244-E10-H5-B2]|nr:MAG: hypothetical protein ES695_11390 [Candidatus Atribacteria bacterium 1244-E10-H5-B2]